MRKVKSMHGDLVPLQLEALPCGGIPIFDFDSGCAYRCDTCFAIIGSIGMPTSCKTQLDAKQTWDRLQNKA